MKEVLHFDGIRPPARHYNHIVRADNFLFVSTQLPVDLATGTMAADDIRSQARQSLDNVKLLIERASATLDDVVKVGIFLANLEDFDAMNDVYNEFFPDKSRAPTRFTLQTKFPDPRIKVEFEAVAYVGSA
jgi:2-iminobutanoate/2-iminopropanoate deaminase